MAKPVLLTHLSQRLRKKLAGMLPIVLGAVILAVLLSLLLSLLIPVLPVAYQQIILEIQRGDWDVVRENLSSMFESYGATQVYVFLTIQVLQVLFAPIPGQVLGLLGGYLFGFWSGLGLTMIGLGTGSWLAIGVGRLFGVQIVRRFLPPSVLSKFDDLISEGGLWNFFLLFLLPALPDDAICFMAGLTRLPIWQLLLVCLLGRLPGMAVLTFVGASVGTNMVIANVVLAVALIAACLLWIFDEEVEAFFYRLSRADQR